MVFYFCIFILRTRRLTYLQADGLKNIHFRPMIVVLNMFFLIQGTILQTMLGGCLETPRNINYFKYIMLRYNKLI